MILNYPSSPTDVSSGPKRLSKMETKLYINDPDELIQILKLPISRRGPEEIEKIVRATENFPFFEKYITKKKFREFNIHEKCCRQMTHEFHCKNSIIFNQGDEGDKLYFVLSGSLSFYTKMTPEEIEIDNKQKEEQMRAFLQGSQASSRKASTNSIKPNNNRNSGQIGFDENLKTRPSSFRPSTVMSNLPARASTIKSQQKMEAGRPEIKIEPPSGQRKPSVSFTRSPTRVVSQALTESDCNSPKYERGEIRKGTIPSVRLDLVGIMENTGPEPGEQEEEEVDILKEETAKKLRHMRCIVRMGSGSIFGEIALTVGKNRMATVVADRDCSLGVLSKEDFDRLLLPLERKRFKKRMTFFELMFGLTLSWEESIRLMYMFEKKRFVKHQNIFVENAEIDGFYVVKSGSILVYKEFNFQQAEEKGGDRQAIIEDERKALTQHILKKSVATIKSKYPIQILAEGDFLGEEALLDYRARLFAAECKSDSATLYYVPTNNIHALMWHIRKHSTLLLQRFQNRVEWRNQRLQDSQIHIHKVLKPSRSKNDQSTPTLYTQRVLTKDISNAFSTFHHQLYDSHNPLQKASYESIASIKDPFNSAQNTNRNSAVTSAQCTPAANTGTFNIINTLFLDSEEGQQYTRRHKILVRARSIQRTTADSESPDKKINPFTTTFREACGRLGPSMKRVAKSSLKMLVDGGREQENFRERMAKSLNSGRRSRGKKSGPLFIKIQGLESSQERNATIKSTESFAMSKPPQSYRKTFENYPKNVQEWFKSSSKVRDSSPMYDSMLQQRQSIGASSSKEGFSKWSEMVDEVKLRESMPIREFTTSINESRKAFGETSKSLKILDLTPLSKEFPKLRGNEGKSSSRKIAIRGFEEACGQGKGDLHDMQGPIKNLAMMPRKGTPEMRRVKKVTVGLVLDPNKTRTRSPVDQMRGGIETMRMIGDRRAEKSEKNQDKKGKDDKLVRKTKHNMFRVAMRHSRNPSENGEIFSMRSSV